ncbi:MAG: phenylalanine--tRNA ligase subunit beta [Cyanobacteria bacterium P01_E01_bin.42]
MQISIAWLQELVDIELPPEKLAETLTIAGFEVEDIEDRRQWADGVVVGKVLKCDRHPNADKLSVCEVDIGQETPSTIVCGASNVKADIFVAVAPPKTYLPIIDLKLKAAKLRGIKSFGMICSLKELGLEKESAGIHIFEPENLEVGTDVRPLLGLDDIILDLTSTANRADALSMVGVAREVTALTGGELHLPDVAEVAIAEGSGLKVAVEESKGCPVYIGTVIEGVAIAPSPDWLQTRLKAAGVRPINNVVDVTNLVLLEWGQPLHAFDRDRLQTVTGATDLTVSVRYAKDKEVLKTLDGQERPLQKDNFLITANDTPVALAGVMGGEETEVHDGTTNLLLEAALFDPVFIRRSARAQGLRTEASARYERGVNQAELDVACNRAIALILELAGGKVVQQDRDDNRSDRASWSPTIELRLDRIHKVLGKVKGENGSVGDLAAEDVERILTALGCVLEPAGTLQATSLPVWRVTVPPYRYRDLEREIDLIEEVARLYGYDRFCETLPSQTLPGGIPTKNKTRTFLREAFRGIGLTELVHYSLVKPEVSEVPLSNPLLSEYSALRKELLDEFVNAYEYNFTRGNGALNAFELGRIFSRDEEGRFCEAEAIAGILSGDFFPQGRWTTGGKGSPMSWYEAKGLLESAFERLGIQVDYRASQEDDRLHPGRTASLWLSGKRLGIFGQLHPQVRRDRDLPDEIYLFQLDAGLLFEAIDLETRVKFEAFSPYPAVELDLAFFAPIDLPVAELENTMKEAGGDLLIAVELFDRYLGKNVPDGQHSLAFNLAYRASDRTLTDSEIEPVHQKVREALTEKFAVTLRS